MADPNSRDVAATTTGIARRFNVMAAETGEAAIPDAGGNLNGTNATSILHHQAGTDATREQSPRAFGAAGSGNYTGVRFDPPDGDDEPPPDEPPIDEPDEPPADPPGDPPADDPPADDPPAEPATFTTDELHARRVKKRKPPARIVKPAAKRRHAR